MTEITADGRGSRWFGFRPEVAFQLANVLVVSIAILIAALIDPSPLRTSAFVIALTIFASATVLAFVLGRSASDRLLVVPVLGLIALIVMRQMPEEHIHALGYLAVFPALWMGWSGRPWFAAVAVVLSMGMIESPGMSGAGNFDLEHALNNFLIPAVVAIAAASTCIASRRTAATICSLTEQKKTAAEALQREQQTSKMLDAILDAVDTAVVAYDADGNQLLANKRAQHHPSIDDAGVTRLEELSGSLYETDRVTPVPRGEGIIGRALQGEEYVNRVLWVGAPEGRQYAVSSSARALVDEHGDFTGTVVAMNDVTSYLEHIAAKDDFVASVSHELRTPLASIVGYLELLEDYPDLPEDARQSLVVIDRNARRLQRLITDLLATASVTERAPMLQRERSDISELAAEVTRRFAKQAASSGVRLRVNAPETAMAMVDRARMCQAFDNLISNAVKFSPGGEVYVTVRSEAGTVVFDVADTGVGIPAEELDAIPTRFYRATTVRQHFPGLGLGLSVCRAVIEAHNGSMVVASEERRGTRVTVTLPAH